MNIPLLPLAFLDSMSPGELFLIFGVILLLFGPKRLPEFSRMAGRAMVELRRASQEFKDQVMKIDETPAVKTPAVDVESSVVETPPDATVARDGAGATGSATASKDERSSGTDKKGSEDELAG